MNVKIASVMNRLSTLSAVAAVPMYSGNAAVPSISIARRPVWWSNMRRPIR